MKRATINILCGIFTAIALLFLVSCITESKSEMRGSTAVQHEDEEHEGGAADSEAIDLQDGDDSVPECESGEESEDEQIMDDVIIHHEDDEVIFRVLLRKHPGETYHFVVSKNGILDASLGTGAIRHNADLSDAMDTIDEHATLQLTSSELEELLEMVAEIERLTEVDELDMLGSGWHFMLFYNGEFYAFNYSTPYPPVRIKFVDQLIRLSPIPKPSFWGLAANH